MLRENRVNIQDNLDKTLDKLNSDTPNMLELNKLVEAIELWDSKS